MPAFMSLFNFAPLARAEVSPRLRPTDARRVFHLQPHKTKNRTFIVAAKDKKTVVDAMKNM